MAVAGLVVRQVQAAGQRHRRFRQGRFDRDGISGIDNAMRDIEGLQDLGGAQSRREFVLGLENLQHAAAAVIVGDPGLLAQLHQAGLAVMRDALHPRLVDGETFAGAVGDEGGQPLPLPKVEAWTQHQRCMLREQPAHDLERHARRGPRAGEPGTDPAGIAEAGFQRRSRSPVDHRHFMAGFGQIVGAGGADHAGAENDDFHGVVRNTSRWTSRARSA